MLTNSDAAVCTTPADSVPVDPSTPSHWPETVRKAFSVAPNISAAHAFTRQLAGGHYENFSVVSALLPRRLRQGFCNVYAFCRIADDLGDELGSREQSLRLLGRFREETLAMYSGNPRTVVFQALAGTVAEHDIPMQPFLDLIDAFEQDQRVDRYATYDQLLDYCRRSANPVGQLVLFLCGYRDEQRQHLSDLTCTALQMANFWQDVRGDLLDRDRIYIPQETMDQFGVTEEQLRAGACNAHYRSCIKYEVDRTSDLFDAGEALLPMLDDGVRPQIALFGRGGRAILRAIVRQDYDTLTHRPTLSNWQKGRLVVKVMAQRITQIVQQDLSPKERA